MRLARTPRVGPVTFFQLLSRFGSAKRALQELPKISARHTQRAIPSKAHIEEEYERLTTYGAEIICACEPTYPLLLAQVAPPPPVLTCLGDLDLLGRRSVAIVGARQASAAGRALARRFAVELSEAGFVVVSGLARGIDGEAHAASLEGGTVAVLGGGIDHVYPPQHAELYEAVRDQGLLISESPFGYRATARDFPRRNRIVTGLSEGVVVVEAAERSGSLISARTALEQNREVMAIPGSPLDPRYAGNNRLLRDGAQLVRDTADVIEALSSQLPRQFRAPQGTDFEGGYDPSVPIPEDQIAAVRAALTVTPVPIDEIARAATIGVHRCAAILVELELAGLATTHAGGLASAALE